MRLTYILLTKTQKLSSFNFHRSNSQGYAHPRGWTSLIIALNDSHSTSVGFVESIQFDFVVVIIMEVRGEKLESSDSKSP